MMQQYFSGQRREFSGLISLITLAILGIAPPCSGANIVSFSDIQLRLTQFNQFPQNIGAEGDVKTINISDIGIVETQIEGEAIFFAEDTTIFAESLTQTLIRGIGSQFRAKTTINTHLIGQFNVMAQETLDFDLEVGISLNNFSDDINLLKASSLGKINLQLQNIATQETVNILNILGIFNTNAEPQLNRDIWLVDFHPNLNLLDYRQTVFLQENIEFWEIFLKASWQIISPQDTQFILIAETQSCNSASNQLQVCAVVPESSFSRLFIWGLGTSGILLLSPHIMQQMIKFTHQPFFKHFMQNLLINFWR